MRKRNLIILLIFFVGACTASQHIKPAEDDLNLARKRVPGITMMDLHAGYKVYTTKCSGCHALHNPKEYSATQWKPILSEMLAKAKMNDEREKKLVSDYLVAKSR